MPFSPSRQPQRVMPSLRWRSTTIITIIITGSSGRSIATTITITTGSATITIITTTVIDRDRLRLAASV